MSKIVKITEEQYNAYVNGEDVRKSIIDEALHYPYFLDDLKAEAEYCINNEVHSMMKNNEVERTFNPVLRANQYFKNITVTLKLLYNEDIDANKNYHGFANSDETLEDNLLKNAFLDFTFPVSVTKELNTGKMDMAIGHEIGHLYDDYSDLLRGGKGIFNRESTPAKKTILFNKTRISRDKLLNAIGSIAYLSIYTESNSFTAQIKDELKGLKANHDNIQDKFKGTVSYQNLRKTEDDFNNIIDKYTEIDLFHTNSRILNDYGNTDIPKMNKHDFNGEKYRVMLKRWADRVLRKLANRYRGVVQLYKDELTESYYTNNCFIVF